MVVGISVKCDALIMAGGESQLSAVIADWWLSNFSEAVWIAHTLCQSEENYPQWSHGVHSVWLAQRVRYLRELFGCQRTYTGSKPSNVSPVKRKFLSSHLFPHNSSKSKVTYSNFFKIISRFFSAVLKVAFTACFVQFSMLPICSRVKPTK